MKARRTGPAREAARDAPQGGGAGNLLAVGEHAQACALAVFSAGAVPQNGQDAAVVGQVVEAEPVPGVFRQQWMDLDGVVGARPQPHQAGDDQVAIAGVIVVVAAPLECALPDLHRPRLPLTREGI